MREGRETSSLSGLFATVSVSVLDNTAGIVFVSESILARSEVMIDISSSPFDISIPDFSLVCLDREIVYVVVLSGLMVSFIVICAELLRVISVTSLSRSCAGAGVLSGDLFLHLRLQARQEPIY